MEEWSRASERELHSCERRIDGLLDGLLDGVRRLQHQRDRPSAGLLDPASGPDLVGRPT